MKKMLYIQNWWTIPLTVGSQHKRKPVYCICFFHVCLYFQLGRGRFSVVRRCQEILTGQEVAVKFVNRRRRTRDQTRGEHSILARLRHSNIATAAGLFVTPSSDAIVMDLWVFSQDQCAFLQMAWYFCVDTQKISLRGLGNIIEINLSFEFMIKFC